MPHDIACIPSILKCVQRQGNVNKVSVCTSALFYLYYEMFPYIEDLINDINNNHHHHHHLILEIVTITIGKLINNLQ